MRISVLLACILAAGAAAADAASVTRAPFGTAPDGQVELITLANDHGMTAKVSTRGGAFVELEAPDRNGRPANVVLGHDGFAEWEKAGGFNTVIGRFANRIANGGFTLDGHFYPIGGASPANKVVLHSGPSDYAGRIFAAAPFQHGGDVGVMLTLKSPDGDGGFPGALDLTMTYTLTAANVVRIDYRATTTKPTVLNLTNHTYFNLAGSGTGTVDPQVLQVFASRYTPADARQIPTGELASVAGTPLDFRTPARIGERVRSSTPQLLMAKGIDHNFVLDGTPGGAPFDAVRLTDPASGRVLTVRTTEPGVQIYTGNGLNGGAVGTGGQTLRQGDGIAFETQHFPDSPNQPTFPTTVLRPGQTFRSTTEWAFSTEGGAR
ncbi:aldose epimerase family protein [Sphingomonas nostoxanthinifaciens]|uniref:aldose epimerase family protein n=1 Tax=Sphingomonas nostoxanthinifaciens TaxID=2872652 RepID=UPI001CC1F727|nr:aldose epimerase family protein [Sphingomonas nostoxanthinifaciens]UAK24780.1 galactose mutarotase [Sphingomonas nostoxanthinifaciens]